MKMYKKTSRKRKQTGAVRYGKKKRYNRNRFNRAGRRFAKGAGGVSRTGSGKYGAVIPYSCKRGLMAAITAGETVLSATSANFYNYVITAYYMPSSDVQLSRYFALFDEYKMVKHYTEIWLNESDEFTEANFQMPRLYYCYDPNSRLVNNFTAPDASVIQRNPNHKMVFMRPGVKYRFTIYPKFGVFNVQSGSTTNVNSMIADVGNSWRPTGYAPTLTDNAINCWMISVQGKFPAGTELLRSRRVITYAFRHRTQGFMVNEV